MIIGSWCSRVGRYQTFSNSNIIGIYIFKSAVREIATVSNRSCRLIAIFAGTGIEGCQFTIQGSRAAAITNWVFYNISPLHPRNTSQPEVTVIIELMLAPCNTTVPAGNVKPSIVSPPAPTVRARLPQPLNAVPVKVPPATVVNVLIEIPAGPTIEVVNCVPCVMVAGSTKAESVFFQEMLYQDRNSFYKQQNLV